MRNALFAAFAAAGMLPASLLPVFVSVARNGLGFSTEQAAALGGAGIFGAALGALLIALHGVRSDWRRTALVVLAVMLALDLASMGASTFLPLLTIRMLHGMAGGMLTGMAYAAIGRSPDPDRLFGVLLVLQFLLGGVGIALLPSAILSYGTWLLFAVLAGVALLMLLLLPFAPAAASTSPTAEAAGRWSMPRGRLLRALAALFLCEAGHTAASAFMLELGRDTGLDMPTAQLIVGTAAMSGLAGGIAATVIGTRFGRTVPILYATAAGIVASALVVSGWPSGFGIGAYLGSLAWAWSIPYVLGLCATIDPERRGALWSSFVAKLGLAAGPSLGAWAMVGEAYWPAILLSCLMSVGGAILCWLERPSGKPGMPLRPALASE
jgi:predicted MFS family arabinose efflux permease